MDEYIIKKIEEIFDIVTNTVSNSTIISPQDFNSTIHSVIIDIMENGIKPVAYIVLSFFFLLELYSISIRFENAQGMTGAEIPFKALIKIALSKYVVDNAKLILDGIYLLSAEMIKNISTLITAEGTLTQIDIEAIKQVLSNMDPAQKLLVSVEVTLVYIVVKFAVLFVLVILVARTVEIYIYMAIAPIPLATFPHAEISSVGKNFLKSFFAVCIQGVLLYIVITMFPFLFGNNIMGDISDPTDFTSVITVSAGYSLVLLVAVFFTGKWSKSICNAM